MLDDRVRFGHCELEDEFTGQSGSGKLLRLARLILTISPIHRG
jgi:hypothetical protein